MENFSLKIIASDKIFYEGPCFMIVVPCIDGEYGIMAHHENMIIATDIGEVRFKEHENDEWTFAAVGIGFIYISHNRVRMLVDTAERPEDIDEKRAKDALERAKEQLRQKQSIQEYHLSQSSMARALTRLREISHKF